MSDSNDDKIRFCSKPFKSLDEEKDERASETKHDGEENNLLCDVDKSLSCSTIEAGSYYLGPIVKKYIRTTVTQCLARKKGTDEYYLMKILILKDGNLKDKFHLHRRAVFHTEYTILSLLKGHPGVIQLHDFFKDCVADEEQSEGGSSELKRICMVLECLIPHGGHNAELTPLSEYLAEKKRLCEAEALRIFANILLVIEDLHNRNIVHKDLKLSNIILNRRSLDVKLINFYYAKLLISDAEVSYNQRGTPFYSAPDAIAGKPVSPKPCDMWSAGVILYTVLHGYLPFIGNPNWGSALANTRSLADLYSKIIINDYVISDDICVSDGTKNLIRGLLCKDPNARLKAGQAVDMLRALLDSRSSSSQTNAVRGVSRSSDHVVPECPEFEPRGGRGSPPSCTECWLIVNANVPNVTSKTYKIAISEVESKMASRGRSGKSEKDVASRRCARGKGGGGGGVVVARRSAASRSNRIKFAMLRLGATSVSNIAALSFNYRDRNSSRSQL